MLRSILWKWLQDFKKATRLATLLGVGLAFTFFASGLFLIVDRQFYIGAWLVFTGIYLASIARSGYKASIASHGLQTEREKRARWLREGAQRLIRPRMVDRDVQPAFLVVRTEEQAWYRRRGDERLGNDPQNYSGD